jgi:hypothetical protein
MPYGKCDVLKEKTIELGTDIESLTKGSRQKIAIKCQDCLVEIIREYKGYKGIHKCRTIIDGRKKCFKCNLKKEIDEFAKNRASHDGYAKLCKECYSNYGSVKSWYKKKSLKIKKDIKEYFKHKTLNLKSRCKGLGVKFDLDNNTLYDLYIQQDKKCYYSGIEIIHGSGTFFYNSISIDKKDPSGGYTKNNIVLCCFCVNSFKGEKNEEEFKQMLKEMLPNLQEFAGVK